MASTPGGPPADDIGVAPAGAPAAPRAPTVPDGPDPTDAATAPATPEATDAATAPATPEAPDAPGTPDAQEIPGRRAPMALVTGVFVLLVLLIVAALLVVKVARGTNPSASSPVASAPEQIVHAAATVPARSFDVVGAPAPVGPLPVVMSGQRPLLAGGRPEVVFVGSEFCPYCAAARWALVVALSRFGTFAHLGETSSSAFEVFPGIETFSFDRTTYRSRYLSWSAVEEYGQALASTAPAGFQLRHRPTTQMEALMRRYGSGATTALPFIDIGNRVLIEGAGIGFSPGALQGASMGQIADDLSTATSPVAQAVLGAANEIAAAVCAQTGSRPGAVCRSPGVRAAASRLGL